VTEKLKIEEAKETHLTIGEVQKALDSLSEADMIRLSKIEELFARNNPTSTLLADAIIKTFDGTRSWKRGMGVCEHMYGVMRSLANNDHKKKTISKRTVAFTNDEGEENLRILHETSSPSPETLLIEREYQEEHEQNAQTLANQVLDLFADDGDAMMILMGMMDDIPAEEIRELSGMDQTSYNTTRKRIRRKLDRKYPEKKMI
jgi:DNA-directed RNA polymerase specialized sigma24 family protein